MARAHMDELGIISDPYAVQMLRRPFARTERALRWPPFRRLGRNTIFAGLAVRTLAFDNAIKAALEAGVGQVVIVGAGYDSRAWRLSGPGVRYWEVDHPATQAEKKRVAPAVGSPCWVPIDLVTQGLAGPLRTAGVAGDKPAVFVVEGLTMYLSEERVRVLCSELNGLAGPGSSLVINFAAWPSGRRTRPADTTSSGKGDESALRKALVAMQDEPFIYQPTVGEATRLLNATGWSVGELLAEPELAMRYLTGTGLPVTVNPAAFVVVATAAATSSGPDPAGIRPT